MFYMLGGMIGVWLVYALFACIFKHVTGLIITSILGLSAGISALVINGNYFTLIASVLAMIVIYACVPLQIRSKKKELRKQTKNNNVDSKK